MAKKKAEEEETGGNGEGKVRKPPAGYRRTTAVDDAPWVQAQVGNVLNGRLIDRFVMNTSPKRAYYQVELFEPCAVRVGRGDDAEVVQAEKGDVVNLGETFRMTAIKDRIIPEVRAGAVYDLWILWQVKPPSAPIQPLPPDETSPAEEGAEGEEAPF
jgi:hypothetical protein